MKVKFVIIDIISNWTILAIFPIIIFIYFAHPLLELCFEHLSFPVMTGKLCPSPPQEETTERRKHALLSSIILLVGLTLTVTTTLIDITLPIRFFSGTLSEAGWTYAWFLSLMTAILARLFALSYSIDFARIIFYQFVFTIALLILGASASNSKVGVVVVSYISNDLGGQLWIQLSVLAAIVAFIFSEALIEIRRWFPSFFITTDRHISEIASSADRKEYAIGWNAVVRYAKLQLKWEIDCHRSAQTIRWIAAKCPPDFTADLSQYIKSAKNPTNVNIRIIAQDDPCNREILLANNLTEYTKFTNNIGPRRLLILNDRRALIAYNVGPKFIYRHERISNFAYVERCCISLSNWCLIFDDWWEKINE